ncbi:hypothetical protein BJ912DRAFT_1057377 [Pholiota molesta]|nr:hypothetical protein BJ912DRAFT_1057377 [Pholiota molesta]
MPRDPSLSQAKSARRNARRNAQNQSQRSQNNQQPENQAGPSHIQLPTSTNPRTLSQILETPTAAIQTPRTPQSGNRRSRLPATPATRELRSKRTDRRITPPSLQLAENVMDEEVDAVQPQRRLFQAEIAGLQHEQIQDVFNMPEPMIFPVIEVPQSESQPPQPASQPPLPISQPHLPAPARIIHNVRHPNPRRLARHVKAVDSNTVQWLLVLVQPNTRQLL